MLERIRNNAIVKFVEKNAKIIICLVTALVLALAIIGYFRNYRRENFELQDTDPQFIMFYVDWCPHCKQAKPEFENCKNQSVTFKTVNCEKEENKEFIQGFDIEGYPTFVLLKDGKKTYYDGERTKAGMEEWLGNQGL